MCRSISEGGRRCPACSPKVRREKRKLLKLAPEGVDLSSHRVENAKEVQENKERLKVSSDRPNSHSDYGFDMSVLGDDVYGGVSEVLRLRDVANNTYGEFSPEEVADAQNMLNHHHYGVYSNSDSVVFAKAVGQVIASNADARFSDDEWAQFRSWGSRVDELMKKGEMTKDEREEFYLLQGKTREFIKTLGTYYLDELKKIRPFGSAKHRWATGSSKELIGRMEDALGLFPDSWVQKSDSHKLGLRLDSSRSRPHYGRITEGRVEYSSTVERSTFHSQEDLDGFLRKANGERSEIFSPKVTEVLSENGEKSWVVTYTPPFKLDTYSQTDPRILVKGTGVPKKYSAKSTEWREVHRYTDSKGKEHIVWATPAVTTTRRNVSKIRADHFPETLAHEFSHRCEDVYPQIALMEGEFLESRRKVDPDTGKLEGLEQIYPEGGKYEQGELGYRDSFAHHYMGKVYYGRSFEILSMGVEAIFYGEHGGFIERSDGSTRRSCEDLESRDFVLGLLATV